VVGLQFQWNPSKNRANEKKHGVSFTEAESAFSDEHGLFMADPDHSEDEDRFVLIGMSASLRVLVVCHCYRKAETVIHIISARMATRAEQRQYSQRWKQ
jgi:uncharacterized DUF497 family protein